MQAMSSYGSIGRCGLCGQPLDSLHTHENPGERIRVEYEIVGIRGSLADFVAVDDPSDKDYVPVDILTRALKVAIDSLPGLHYTCLVSRDSDGTTRSKYRAILWG
jgi:hypothetical protein